MKGHSQWQEEASKDKFTLSTNSIEYSQVFLDRIKTQEQIEDFLAEVFGAKKRISLEEFKRINVEESSEMFLSIMILLQNQLPCTENFFRY